VLLLSAGLAGATVSFGQAQVAAPIQQAAAPDVDVIKRREQELEAARRSRKMRRSCERSSRPISPRSARIAASSIPS